MDVARLLRLEDDPAPLWDALRTVVDPGARRRHREPRAGLRGGAVGVARDAMLHALFLGFVISMVFGHAPVILPAVLRVPLPYAPRFYLHLGLLHAGLVVRVVAGDVLGIAGAWQAGGVLTVTAVLVFVGSSAAAAVEAILRARRPGTPSVATSLRP